MIVAHGGRIVHLGGPRGDRLSAGAGEGALEPIADLGWDARTQTTPQRRLLLLEDAVLVLEPARGPLLRPPLRVRRFDLAGGERDVQEGEEEGDPDLHFLAERDGPGALRLRRFGIDPASGRALVWEGRLDAPLERHACSGKPLRAGEEWWYPLREAALVRVGPGGVLVLRGPASRSVEAVAGRVVCAARGGAWVDGRWRRLRGPALFPPYRFPPLGMAAPAPAGGIVLLRREGGVLPVLDGEAGGRLPPGLYGGLAALGGTLLASAEGPQPRLIAVRF